MDTNPTLSAKDFRNELLRVLGDKSQGKANRPIHHKDIYEDVALLKGVARDQYGVASGTTIKQVDRWIQWAFKALVDEGLGKRAGKGQWALTPQGALVVQGLTDDPQAITPVVDDQDETSETSEASEASEALDASEIDAVSLPVGPGQSEGNYHSDPYIRALAAQDTSCFSAYSDKSPTCNRCLLAGACMNAMAAELSALARELALEDKEAETRKKMGVNTPPAPPPVINDTSPVKAESKTRVNGAVVPIIIQQQSICQHCGAVLAKGQKGWWVKSTSTKAGGIYHEDCLEVEGQ